jgi:hypothetical protein
MIQTVSSIWYERLKINGQRDIVVLCNPQCSPHRKCKMLGHYWPSTGQILMRNRRQSGDPSHADTRQSGQILFKYDLVDEYWSHITKCSNFVKPLNLSGDIKISSRMAASGHGEVVALVLVTPAKPPLAHTDSAALVRLLSSRMPGTARNNSTGQTLQHQRDSPPNTRQTQQTMGLSAIYIFVWSFSQC